MVAQVNDGIAVVGCQLIELCPIGDERGWLVSLESSRNVPFDIKRVYYIYGTESFTRRGMHAHHKLEQLVVCVSGSCSFMVDDGTKTQCLTMNTPRMGLHIQGVVWREMSDFTPDCVLMVLASEHYDEADYIRNYDEFVLLKRKSPL